MSRDSKFCIYAFPFFFFFIIMVGSPAALFGQGIVGSAHDFNTGIGNGWYTSDQICIPCHVPHNADTSVAAAPLWNHEVTVATFTPFSSATMDAIVGQPDESSKLCLSCHDGTVGIDSS